MKEDNREWKGKEEKDKEKGKKRRENIGQKKKRVNCCFCCDVMHGWFNLTHWKVSWRDQQQTHQTSSTTQRPSHHNKNSHSFFFCPIFSLLFSSFSLSFSSSLSTLYYLPSTYLFLLILANHFNLLLSSNSFVNMFLRPGGKGG